MAEIKAPCIKFSEVETKLLDADGTMVRKAKLLLVISVAQESFARAHDFIDYETDHGQRSIPYSTFHLILLLQKPSGDLFTSVRPQWGKLGDKKPYYDALVGKELDIIITKNSFS